MPAQWIVGVPCRLTDPAPSVCLDLRLCPKPSSGRDTTPSAASAVSRHCPQQRAAVRRFLRQNTAPSTPAGLETSIVALAPILLPRRRSVQFTQGTIHAPTSASERGCDPEAPRGRRDGLGARRPSWRIRSAGGGLLLNAACARRRCRALLGVGESCRDDPTARESAMQRALTRLARISRTSPAPAFSIVRKLYSHAGWAASGTASPCSVDMGSGSRGPREPRACRRPRCGWAGMPEARRCLRRRPRSSAIILNLVLVPRIG